MIRVLFVILLLVNVLVFIAIRQIEQQPGAAAQIAALQINPQKVKVLKSPPDVASEKTAHAKTPASASVATAPAAAAPPAPLCYDWGEFTQADAPRARALLSELFERNSEERVTQRETGDPLYWVYIPGLKSKLDADKKAAEVKALKVGDLSVTVDGDAWMVSLGAFKTEENANQRFAQVKKLGVRSAVVGQRGQRGVIFTVRDPGEAAAQLAAFKTSDGASLPLKAVACATAP